MSDLVLILLVVRVGSLVGYLGIIAYYLLVLSRTITVFSPGHQLLVIQAMSKRLIVILWLFLIATVVFGLAYASAEGLMPRFNQLFSVSFLSANLAALLILAEGLVSVLLFILTAYLSHELVVNLHVVKKVRVPSNFGEQLDRSVVTGATERADSSRKILAASWFCFVLSVIAIVLGTLISAIET